ncbi:myosin heavy chain-like protein [Wolffia australiana]
MPSLHTGDPRLAYRVHNSMINIYDASINKDDHDDDVDPSDVLEDFDSYMEDINSRLTVSRMVSDSVVKGMINAIAEGSAETISSKDEEINELKRRLKLYESSFCSRKMNDELMSDLKISSDNHILKLKGEVEKLRSSDHGRSEESLIEMDISINSLTEIFNVLFRNFYEMNSVLSSLDEQLWQGEIQKEFHVFIIEEKLREVREDCEKQLCEQRSLFESRYDFWLKKVKEIEDLRQELEFVSKSMLFVEQEHHHHLSSGLQEAYEEWIHIKSKDDSVGKVHGESSAFDISKEIIGKTVLDDRNSYLLAHMSKEELMGHYKAEIREIKRQLESSVHEKTEELFRLKRQIFKERDLYYSKREKELEALKKRLPDLYLRLDEVLREAKKFSSVECSDKTISFQQRIDELFSENRTLHNLLVDERKELNKKVESYSLMEKIFLKEKKELESELESARIEAFLNSQVHEFILKQLIHDFKSTEEDVKMVTDITREVFNSILGILITDAQNLARLNILHRNEKKTLVAIISQKDMILKSEMEKGQLLAEKVSAEVKKSKQLGDELEKVEKIKKEVLSLSTLVSEKDLAISIEVKKSKELIHEISSLRTLIAEKDKYIIEMESNLRKREDVLDEQLEECSKLKAEVRELEISVLGYIMESDILKSILYEASNVIRVSVAQISDLNKELVLARCNVERLEVDCGRFYDIIREKEIMLSFIRWRADKQAEKMETMTIFIQKMSTSVAEFETIVLRKLERQSLRLEGFLNECDQLSKLANNSRKKVLKHKKELEIILFNHERAENEVDRLGDEVDDLVSVLEKVYIALDHYSPVLQHYTGVMEMLEMVKRKLNEVNSEAH